METNIIIQDRTKDIAELSIIQSIYEIRGYRVMLDFDLAKRYDVETRRLNEQVRRNIERFPSDFMFQITNQEFKNLKSQIATSSWGGTRKMPLAFTQEGVAMLSGVVHSKKAIEANIDIMRAFVVMRQYFWEIAELKQELENFMRQTNAKLDKNDMRFERIFKLLDEFLSHKKELEKPRTPIGFKGKNN
jgi:hypothetical protein